MSGAFNGSRRGRNASGIKKTETDWITPIEFAEEFHVGRTTAYTIFERLETRVKVGRLVRARRSEIEERLALYGEI